MPASGRPRLRTVGDVRGADRSCWRCRRSCGCRSTKGFPSYISGSLASVAVERARTELFLPDLRSGGAVLRREPAARDLLRVLGGTAGRRRRVARARRPAVALRDSAPPNALPALVSSRWPSSRTCRSCAPTCAERFGDAAVPIVLLAAWTVGTAAAWTSPGLRADRSTLVPALLLVQMFVGGLRLFRRAPRARHQRLVRFVGQDRAALRRPCATNCAACRPPTWQSHARPVGRARRCRATSRSARALTIAFS